MIPPSTIRVSLPGVGHDDRSYDIVVGRGVIGGIGRAVAAAGCRRGVVISDASVAATHGRNALAALEAAGVEADPIAVPRGESSKSIGQLAQLWNALAGLAVDRRVHLVAVGGGVVGDLAGFAAATFVRGLAVWHLPTTLVAQVDSSIGGKTGINLESGKNLVGSFWQPRGVIADVATLASLPDREFRSGLAEVVKYGVILDPALFAWLEANHSAILARDPAALIHVVGTSAALKADVVSQDERELSGLRAILNYGHTFAHAYETTAGYGTLLHGEAVAIGMTDAAELAVRLGRIAPAVAARQRELLARFDLPTTAPEAGHGHTDALLAVMSRDKKTVAGRLRFVLPSRIGHVELVEGVPTADVRAVLDRSWAAR